jgi:2-polyprenyl-3-methyl-5-hydroxy-6-metoxy-1,4-benzoquinol methylase
VRCPGCRLVFQDPQPDPAVVESGYYHDPSFTAALFGPLRDWTRRLAEHKVELLEATAGRLEPGRALDVGCSSGAWLEVAGERGWRATGIELGATTAEAARRRGLDVRTGTLDDVAPVLAGERFDLITFWDVLEHVRDPRRELALAARMLSPRGVLAASTPNIEGWYPRLTYRLLARRTHVWEHPELPLHIHDFGPATITRLLDRAGFRVTGLRTWAIPYSFYRETVLSSRALGRRGLALRAAFRALQLAVYPPAQLFDRSNALAVAAVRADARA